MNESSPAVDAARTEAELVAACALSCVPGVGAATLARVAAAFGSPEQAVAAGSLAMLSRTAQLRLAPRTRGFLEQEPKLEGRNMSMVLAPK